jgi:hypothetical protein
MQKNNQQKNEIVAPAQNLALYLYYVEIKINTQRAM